MSDDYQFIEQLEQALLAANLVNPGALALNFSTFLKAMTQSWSRDTDHIFETIADPAEAASRARRMIHEDVSSLITMLKVLDRIVSEEN